MPDSLLLKFQKLPDPVKANASDPAAMRTLDALEKDFSVNLAELVMRVMVQEVDPAKLDDVLEQQYKVPAGKGKELAKLLLDNLFFKYRLLDVPDVKDVLTAEVPKPPLTPQPGASHFLVHPDDHKDIAPHVSALQSAPPAPIDTEPTRITEKLVALEKLQLDDQLSKRFLKLVESRLVDVRDKAETGSLLQRPVKIGGMGFDEARASRIVSELERSVEEIHRRPKVVVKQTPPPPMPKPVVAPRPPLPPVPTPQSPKVSQTAGQRVDTPVSGNPPVNPPVVPKPAVAPPPWLRPVQAPAPMVRPAATPVARPAAARPAPPAPRPEPTYRDMVTDVRAPVRMMGPVDILGNLTIEDFRRLGTTAADRTGKIAEEIDTLTRESFAQRAAGISAFRQSPTFKAYLQLGQMAMERKEEVSEIIDLLKAQNTASLTPEEFEAIGALMRQFRF